MTDYLIKFDEEAKIETFGTHVFVTAKVENDGASITLRIDTQVYDTSERQEGRASMVFEMMQSTPEPVQRLDIPEAVNLAAYAGCVAASVGSAVWGDYVTCLDQTRATNPNGTWVEHRRKAFRCLEAKRPGMKSAIQSAMISCSATFVP